MRDLRALYSRRAGEVVAASGGGVVWGWAVGEAGAVALGREATSVSMASGAGEGVAAAAAARDLERVWRCAGGEEGLGSYAAGAVASAGAAAGLASLGVILNFMEAKVNLSPAAAAARAAERVACWRGDAVGEWAASISSSGGA